MVPARLQKALALAGIASRRAAETLIREGRVSVNGITIFEMGVSVIPGKDAICVNGEVVTFDATPMTLMLNKPDGYICSADRTQGETVFYLLRDVPQRLFTIGRLDKHSEGLLLLTNDGDLANRLTHPRYEHRKIYEVTVTGPVTPASIKRLNELLVLDGSPIRPAVVVSKLWNAKDHSTLLEFTLKEGRNRQVRKMCDLVGLRILRLCRTQVGNLRLGRLPSGEHRLLTSQEQTALLETSP